MDYGKLMDVKDVYGLSSKFGQKKAMFPCCLLYENRQPF